MMRSVEPAALPRRDGPFRHRRHRGDGERTATARSGMTANAVCSLSLDPLLALVCFANGARTLRVVREQRRFGVNVLAAGPGGPRAPVRVQGARSAEKFAGVQHTVHDGIPVIEGTLAWVGCTLEQLIPGGDHTIGIGAVTAAETRRRARPADLVPRRVPVSGLHTRLGAIAVGVNALAALIGAVAWLPRPQPEGVLDHCSAPARRW